MDLSTLPVGVLTDIVSWSDHATVHAIELVSKTFFNIVQDYNLWQDSTRRGVAMDGKTVDLKQTQWKLLGCAQSRPLMDHNLLSSVRECSSVDHFNESPSNTLQHSQCEELLEHIKQERERLDEDYIIDTSSHHVRHLLERAQMHCGCASGQPCYYSSNASWSANVNDWIDYILKPSTIIFKTQIVPYRVFWYPSTSCFAPVRVSFTFREHTTNEESPQDNVYESPEYDVIADMERQEFRLPMPVYLANGIMRINLIGRRTDIGVETLTLMERHNMPPYYVCLTYVGAVGREQPTETDN